MIKEKPKIIIEKAKEMNLYNIPSVKIWAMGTKMRRVFTGAIPNIEDFVSDYLTVNDIQHLIGVNRKASGVSTYYHLAPNLKLYVEVEIQLKGLFSSAYNPLHFPTEMRFHTENQEHIQTIVNEINQLWASLGKGPMLDNLNYKAFKKKFKVDPETIKKTWEAWSSKT